jgi:putative tryptophan/tyrosine transport system substrate-binding protein
LATYSRSGLVSSLRLPGGNITGLSTFVPELTAKRLELLKEAIPSLTKTALLLNPDNPLGGIVPQEIEPTAKELNITLQTFEARRPGEFAQIVRLSGICTGRRPHCLGHQLS